MIAQCYLLPPGEVLVVTISLLTSRRLDRPPVHDTLLLSKRHLVTKSLVLTKSLNGLREKFVVSGPRVGVSKNKLTNPTPGPDKFIKGAFRSQLVVTMSR